MTTFASGLQRYLNDEQRTRLRQACIGIAGAGGLGSNCAVMLARSGVEHFVLVDYDVVDASNLNRQQYLAHHVGMLKVQALSDVLRAINPAIFITAIKQKICTAGDLTLFRECSLVVEAVDDASTKRMIVENCVSEQKTVIAASGMAGWGGCAMQQRQLGNHLIIVGDFCNEVSEGMPPLAPRVTMAAAMQADAVLQCLLGSCQGIR